MRSYQIVSYAFVQGGFLHLVLNLYALWLLGIPLERRWGSMRFGATFCMSNTNGHLDIACACLER